MTRGLTAKLKCRSLWPIVYGPVILPCILKTVWCMNIILWDYESVWPTFDLKISVGHCDLYLMIKWFFLMSWRLFDVWTSLFGILSQYDPKFDLKINIGQCDLISLSSDFALYLEDYLMYEHNTWDYGSVWPDIWPQNKWWWTIFHGPVILSYTFKTIWCMSIIFSDNETVWSKLWPQSKYKSTWPIFHGLVILLNIVKLIWWMNIIVGIMDPCDT